MPRFTITLPDRPPQPYSIELDRKTIRIGRGPGNDIVIDSASVSQFHAELRHLPGIYEIGDLGSTNGITQDGRSYKVIRLQNGTTVNVGDIQCQFSLTDDEIQALAHEANAHASLVATLPAPYTPNLAIQDPPSPPKRPRSPRPAAVQTRLSSGGGFLATVVFLIIAATAFCAGLAIRHQRETGASLIDRIKFKVFD